MDAQLAGEPWQLAVLRIFDGIGEQVDALGIRERAQFDCASALVTHILDLAGQHAAGTRLLPPQTDRSAFLGIVAARWMQQDPAGYPFARKMAAHLREHDDREQFLVGINLVLAGIKAVR